jgi:hypothetical protein
MAAAGLGRAQTDSSVASRRAVVMARALSYDGSLRERAGRVVVMAVVYKKKHPESEKSAEVAARAFKQIENLRVAGAPFRRVVTAYSGGADLERLVDQERVSALYVCDGLEAELPAIKEVSHRKKVLTLGSTEAQVRAGVSLAVVAEGSKMAIVVNWAQSREEGAQFGSDLLRLARVIR